MSDSPPPLEHECAVFTRFLVGCPPEPYVTKKYVEAHRASEVLRERDAFDRCLVAIARKTPLLTKLADSYARILAPRSALRNKLVLLLAILESCAPSYRLIDRVEEASRIGQLLRIALRVVSAAVSLLLGLVFFLPLQAGLRLRKRRV